MPVSSEYLTYVSEQLARVPGLRSRRMFGGVGLYGGELFFGLIADNTLFLRVDDGNREDFTRRGMQPFRPFKDRPGQLMAYYEVPPEVIEDAEQQLYELAETGKYGTGFEPFSSALTEWK